MREGYSNDIENEDSFIFRVNGFRKMSLSFILLVIVLFLFSGAIFSFGIFLIFSVFALLFASYPKIYNYLGWVSKWTLRLAISRRFKTLKVLKIISIIPTVDFEGEWFMEPNSEHRNLKSLRDTLGFIFSHWFEFFVINIGVFAFLTRSWLYINNDQPIIINTVENAGAIDLLLAAGNTFIYGLLFVPVLMAIYFNIVWVWEDAEIKIRKKKKSSNSDLATKDVIETHNLFFASNSLKNFIGLVIGFPAIYWIVEKSAELSQTNNNQSNTGLGEVFIFMFVLFIFVGGGVIFMGVMYYRSGVHQKFVNELRTDVKERYLKGDNSIICATIELIPYKFDEK